MMKPEIKKLWVEALRSGEYEQGQGRLRCADTFCCLGVLCDLHAKATGQDWEGGEYLSEGYVLPGTVQDWAGLDDEIPDVGDDNGLTVHNDGRSEEDAKEDSLPVIEPKTFPEIADLIEKNL